MQPISARFYAEHSLIQQKALTEINDSFHSCAADTHQR